MGNHWAGEYVRYLCNPGYTMIGPAVRRCLPSGKWSGNTPTCKKCELTAIHTLKCLFSFGKKRRITGIIVHFCLPDIIFYNLFVKACSASCHQLSRSPLFAKLERQFMIEKIDKFTFQYCYLRIIPRARMGSESKNPTSWSKISRQNNFS